MEHYEQFCSRLLRNAHRLGRCHKEPEPVLECDPVTLSQIRDIGNWIKHNDTLLTAYAHNKALLVREDQMVRRGQKIAEMGSTDAERVQLHFEIRRQGRPVDPAKLLKPS